MNERLKNIARKLEGSFTKFDSLDDLYYRFRGLIKSQPDYFVHLGPDNLIKIVIYIYSYKTTKGFEMGDKAINNLSFAELLVTNNDNYLQPCKYCGADGDVTCNTCNGNLGITCETCDGEGEVPCDYCEPADEECEECFGEKTVICPDCDGDGETRCPDCDQNGTIQCPECEGEGEVETDEVYCRFWLIATWDKDIKNTCELNVGTTKPIMSETDFLNMENEFIKLSSWDGHDFLNVEPQKMYCINYSDEPALRLTQDYMLIYPNDYKRPRNLEHLQ